MTDQRSAEPATTVVAVHGNGGGGFRFARAVAAMPSDVRLAPVTLPGFGRRPADPALGSLAAYADRLAEEVAELTGDGSAPVLLGHGIGGSIVLDLAARRPERVGAVILHAPVAARLDKRLFPRLMQARPLRPLIQRAIAARALRPLWRRAFFPTGAPAATLERFFEEYRHAEAFGQMFDLITAEWLAALPVVRSPAVLLWGADDRVLRSSQVEDLRRVLPDADVEVVDGWDHFPMIEQPAAYAAEIARLARSLTAPLP